MKKWTLGNVAESPTTSGRFSDFGKMSAISMKGVVSINKNKHHMHFEMTPEQYALLHTNAKACGLSKRAYLIRLIEGKPVKPRNDPDLKTLRTEIHHIGNNINQIARAANAGIANREDIHYSRQLLSRIYDLMYEMGKR